MTSAASYPLKPCHPHLPLRRCCKTIDPPTPTLPSTPPAPLLLSSDRHCHPHLPLRCCCQVINPLLYAVVPLLGADDSLLDANDRTLDAEQPTAGSSNQYLVSDVNLLIPPFIFHFNTCQNSFFPFTAPLPSPPPIQLQLQMKARSSAAAADGEWGMGCGVGVEERGHGLYLTSLTLVRR